MIEQLRIGFALACLFSLSGCATMAPVAVSLPPPATQPQSERPLPPPGSFRQRMGEAVDRGKGRTSAPSSTASPTTPTP